MTHTPQNMVRYSDDSTYLSVVDDFCGLNTCVDSVSFWWGGSCCDYSRSYKILSFPDPAAWNFNPNLMKNYLTLFGFEKWWDMAPYYNGYCQVRRAASPPSATPTPVSPKAEGLESKATKLSECTKGPAGSTTLPLTSGMRNDKNDPMLRPSDVDKLAAEVNEEVKDIGMGLGHVGTSTSLNILHQFWTCYYWISQKNERWCTHMVI